MRRKRSQMEFAGWKHRRIMGERQKVYEQNFLPRQRTEDPFADPTEGAAPQPTPAAAAADADQPPAEPAAGDAPVATSTDEARVATSDDNSAGHRAASNAEPSPSADIFKVHEHVDDVFDPTREQHTGVVLGIALASFRGHDGEDRFLVLPGDDVKLTIPTAGQPPKAVSETFTIVDFYESKMSEYDSGFVFVPIKKLQQLRGMIDPSTGVGNVTSIQIRLKPGVDGDAICRQLRAAFPPELYGVQTWRDKQGPLLAGRADGDRDSQRAVVFDHRGGRLRDPGDLLHDRGRENPRHRHSQVAGRFGQRHHGHLSRRTDCRWEWSARASGLIAGPAVRRRTSTRLPNGLSLLTGEQVFDPEIYYFQKIPTLVDPFTVSWIVTGAMLIAVVASILPARRAARLHPVEALAMSDVQQRVDRLDPLA